MRSFGAIAKRMGLSEGALYYKLRNPDAIKWAELDRLMAVCKFTPEQKAMFFLLAA